ncbi:MAG: pilus assembly protein [Pseudomonadota bacterium]
MLSFNSFVRDESGAVTVDWVILTAGVVSLALAAVGVITDGTENYSGDIENKLEEDLISTSFGNDNDV